MDNNQVNKDETPTKVVSIFAPRKLAPDAEAAAQTEEASSQKESAFLQEMRRNMENAERLRKERLKANQGVLKSYRITKN